MATIFPINDQMRMEVDDSGVFTGLHAEGQRLPLVLAKTDPVTGGTEALMVNGVKIGAMSAINYNPNGTINTYIKDNVTWTCGYDSAGRLSTETASGAGGTVRTYTYDASSGLLSTVEVS